MEISSAGNDKRNDDKGSDVEVGITRSKHWFDDGDVIIQVENTQFRVHRSMLCRHSTAFKDMFDIPQPPQTVPCDSESNDCPLIPLTDKARDFEHIMSIFYDNISFHDMRVPMSFNQCAAILRLGKKYDIEDLLEKGLRRFREMFPDNLSSWHSHDTHRLSWEGIEVDLDRDPFFYERAMALANELSLNRALPAICLSLVRAKDRDGILHSLERHSTTEDDYVFIPHLLMNCVKEHDTVQACRINHKIQEWMHTLPPSSPIPSRRCTNPQFCISNRTQAIITCAYVADESSLPGIGIFGHNILHKTHELDVLICLECKRTLRRALHLLILNTWQDLPSIFGIAARWVDLKDFVY